MFNAPSIHSAQLATTAAPYLEHSRLKLFICCKNTFNTVELHGRSFADVKVNRDITVITQTDFQTTRFYSLSFYAID